MTVTRKGRNCTAFTLVEITITLGITGVVALALVAMLATGLRGAHEAAGRTIGAEIGGRLIGEMQLQDWNTFINHTPEFRFFDEFGEELPPPADPENSAFTAYATVETELPSLATASVVTNPHCRKVVVMVADRPGPAGRNLIVSYLTKGEFSRDLHLYQSAVANLDK